MAATNSAKGQNSPSAGAEKKKKNQQVKTWAQIARLADAGLAALDAGKIQEVRALLTAIRGVGLNADEQNL